MVHFKWCKYLNFSFLSIFIYLFGTNLVNKNFFYYCWLKYFLLGITLINLPFLWNQWKGNVVFKIPISLWKCIWKHFKHYCVQTITWPLCLWLKSELAIFEQANQFFFLFKCFICFWLWWTLKGFGRYVLLCSFSTVQRVNWH